MSQIIKFGSLDWEKIKPVDHDKYMKISSMIINSSKNKIIFSNDNCSKTDSNIFYYNFNLKTLSIDCIPNKYSTKTYKHIQSMFYYAGSIHYVNSSGIITNIKTDRCYDISTELKAYLKCTSFTIESIVINDRRYMTIGLNSIDDVKTCTIVTARYSFSNNILTLSTFDSACVSGHSLSGLCIHNNMIYILTNCGNIYKVKWFNQIGKLKDHICYVKSTYTCKKLDFYNIPAGMIHIKDDTFLISFYHKNENVLSTDKYIFDYCFIKIDS